MHIELMILLEQLTKKEITLKDYISNHGQIIEKYQVSIVSNFSNQSK